MNIFNFKSKKAKKDSPLPPPLPKKSANTNSPNPQKSISNNILPENSNHGTITPIVSKKSAVSIVNNNESPPKAENKLQPDSKSKSPTPSKSANRKGCCKGKKKRCKICTKKGCKQFCLELMSMGCCYCVCQDKGKKPKHEKPEEKKAVPVQTPKPDDKNKEPKKKKKSCCKCNKLCIISWAVFLLGLALLLVLAFVNCKSKIDLKTKSRLKVGLNNVMICSYAFLSFALLSCLFFILLTKCNVKRRGWRTFAIVLTIVNILFGSAVACYIYMIKRKTIANTNNITRAWNGVKVQSLYNENEQSCIKKAYIYDLIVAVACIIPFIIFMLTYRKNQKQVAPSPSPANNNNEYYESENSEDNGMTRNKSRRSALHRSSITERTTSVNGRRNTRVSIRENYRKSMTRSAGRQNSSDSDSDSPPPSHIHVSFGHV